MSSKLPNTEFYEIATSKGSWGMFVQSRVRAQGSDNIFLSVILEQNIGDDHDQIRMRRLDVLAFGPELSDPRERMKVLAQIRNWIEASEGDGFLDLVSQNK